MTARPIIFSGAMVRALLAGHKTQTRRLAKFKPAEGASLSFSGLVSDQLFPGCWNLVSRGAGGCWNARTLDLITPAICDRLWVRETWAVGACAEGLKPIELSPQCWLHENGGCWYRAEGEPRTPISPRGAWRPAIHMPRWVSRLTLTVTDVRVQRLQDITEADAVAEGAMTLDEPIGGWWGAAAGIVKAIGEDPSVARHNIDAAPSASVATTEAA
jgi:hypothetical protein